MYASSPQNWNSLPVHTPCDRTWVRPVGATVHVLPPSIDRHDVASWLTMVMMSLPATIPPYCEIWVAHVSGKVSGRHHVIPPSELIIMSRLVFPLACATKRPSPL